MIRDLLVALSLANLFLIEVWFELLFMPAGSTYYLKAPRTGADYAAAVLTVLLLGLLFTGAIRLGRRSTHGAVRALAHIALVAAVLLPLNAFRLNVRLPLGAGRIWHWISIQGLILPAAALAVLLVILVGRWHRTVARAVYLALLLAFPFALLNLVRAGARAVGGFHEELGGSPLPATVPGETGEGRRVLWLLFDELDESVLAAGRPSGLRLPELDRLRAGAFAATRALPPSESTLLSLPSLLAGRLVEASAPLRPDELEIRFEGESGPVQWGASPNVFCTARASGHPTAVVGWYHPYCRVFARCLDACVFEPVFLTAIGRDESAGFVDRVAQQALTVLPVNRRRLAVGTYTRLLAAARVFAARVRRGLLFVHFSVPHVPVIYDRARGRRTLFGLSNVSGYLDNVALADQALGELRQTLEAGGGWEDTTVLVTSDHGWRESWAFDGRRSKEVPFLLKLAGQKDPFVYDRPFNTVIAADLLLAVLAGELRDPAGVAGWIDRRTAAATSRP